MNEERVYYPLTHPQKQIWYTEKVYPETSIGNIAGTLLFQDEVDFDLLEKAIKQVFRNNDSLCLRVVEVNGEPKQYLSEDEELEVHYIDVKDINELNKWERQQSRTPIRLIDSELYYFAIIRFPDNKGGFYINNHHLINDAWTITLLVSQIVECYSAFKNGVAINPEKKPSYIEYALSEQEYKKSKRFEKDKKYWEDKFATMPEFITLKSRKSFSDIRASRTNFKIPSRLTSDIYQFCKSTQTSVFTLFMAVFSTYISRISSKEDIVIGTHILNRTNTREKNTIGMFISTVPLRLNADSNLPFSVYLQAVARETLSILKHQKYPYELLLKDFRQKHKVQDNLYDVSLSYQNAKYTESSTIEKYKSRWHFDGYATNSLTIHIDDRENEGELEVNYDYLVDLFQEDEIEHIHSHLINLLNDSIKNSDKPLCDLELLSETEKYQLLYEFNNTQADYPRDKTIHQLFEEQVERTPDNVAVEFDSKTYTYSELNHKANQLARKLIEEGVKLGDFVSILMEHSYDTLVSILAILKSGGAYIPLDPFYPDSRLKYMLEDSCSKIVLTQSEFVSRIPKDIKTKIIVVEYENLQSDLLPNSNPSIKLNSQNLAYVIYTSGSTGNPKGAMITHQGLVNYIYWAKKVYLKGEQLDLPLYSSLAFDLTVTSIFTPLISGGKIVVYWQQDKQHPIIQILKENKVDILKLTPAHLQLIKGMDNSHSRIKVLIVGGEDLKTELSREIHTSFNGNIEIYNEYGPTETVVGCMIYKFNYRTDNRSSVPIGVPADNVQIYILDKCLKTLPVGAIGEMYIAGDGVAKGYLNKPELTAEKFISNPFISGKMMYKTGDIARMLSDCNIEYLGRNDHQVKIRGFRIELGDIENQLLLLDCVKEVVVVDRQSETGRKYLCAYIVSDKIYSTSELNTYLSNELPHYMIPSHFVFLDNMPLTPNGKVDKKVLPEPEGVIETGIEYVAPRNDFETQMATLWAKVLEIDKIGIDDNFFDLGGDSLSIIQVLCESFVDEMKLNTQDFYVYPTIRELSNKINGFTEEEFEIETDITVDILKHPDQIEVSGEKIELGNVLLTGATGYLGSHILDELLRNTGSNVYCLVRDTDKQTAEAKLKKVLKYYFPDKYNHIFNERVFIVKGDIGQDGFGLSHYEYERLSNSIKTVIHSGAIVKHYGKYADFESINVKGTKRVIDFCLEGNKKLNHISTVSVSGQYIIEQPLNIRFTENDFYIGQNYKDNVYVRSKFEAENLIFKTINEGLNASIFRVGMLTGRADDGLFQPNITENAFYNRLKSIVELGVVPEDILELDVEFTPIDLCGKAIVDLTKIPESNGKVFHIFNYKTIKMQDLLNMFTGLGFSVEGIESESFGLHLSRVLETDRGKEILRGIINDFNREKELQYRTNIVVESKITQEYLRQLGFEWCEITKGYIEKVVNHMKDRGYLANTSTEQIAVTKE